MGVVHGRIFCRAGPAHTKVNVCKMNTRHARTSFIKEVSIETSSKVIFDINTKNI